MGSFSWFSIFKMFVKHRNQQRIGLEVTEPETGRKCEACKQVFKSKTGLLNHQARKSNPACHRAGALRKKKEWFKEKILQKKKKVVCTQQSMFQKHKTGQSFSKEEKQIYLNIYQSFLDKGIDNDKAVKKTVKCTGISRRSLDKIVKEKTTTGTLTDNHSKYHNTSTVFEKLSEEQVDNIR